MSAITILDGGMGKELRRIGAPFRQPEWSALALLEAPEYVATAHRNFVDAGADVIITNTYALVPFHIGEKRFAARASELAELAARTARLVADKTDRPVLVAGSLPPLFGSYEPDLFHPEAAPPLWRTLIEAQASFVDLWVGETMSSIAEARVLVQTLLDVVADGNTKANKPLWLSFTLADGESTTATASTDLSKLTVSDKAKAIGPATLRSGELMTAVVGLLDELRLQGDGIEVTAVLFNCSQPEVMGPAVAELRALLDQGDWSAVRLGAYANAFPLDEHDDADYAANERILERRADLTPPVYASLVERWVEAGATIVGGCCDIYPAHIAALASTVR